MGQVAFPHGICDLPAHLVAGAVAVVDTDVIRFGHIEYDALHQAEERLLYCVMLHAQGSQEVIRMKAIRIQLG